MRLGFSRVVKKIAKCRQLRCETVDNSIYYFDENNRVVARLYDTNLLNFVVSDQEGKPKSLNLVFSFKYKCDQDVVIADIAFVSDLDNNKLPHVSRNRYLSLKEDSVLDKYGTTSIGTVDVSEGVLTVTIPMLGVEDRCENVVKTESYNDTIFHLTTRTVR